MDSSLPNLASLPDETVAAKKAPYTPDIGTVLNNIGLVVERLDAIEERLDRVAGGVNTIGEMMNKVAEGFDQVMQTVQKGGLGALLGGMMGGKK